MAKISKRTKNKIKKFAFKNFFVCLFLILVLVGVLIFGYFQGWFDKYLKKPEYLSTAGGYVTNVTTLNDLKINFLDVGQGDCIIIELPDGKRMIIDSGKNNNRAKEAINQYISEKNITTFDYLLLTHADEDHVGQMSYIIDNYDIKYIFRPNNYSSHDVSKDLSSDFNSKTDGGKVITSKVYAKFMVSASQEGCPVEIVNKDSDFTNKIIYNEKEYLYTFDFLTPVADKDKVAYSDPNNYSPIILLTYGDTKIMFTGDAEEKMLEEYVTTYGNTNNVDVLKVGHHGSENATTTEFLQAIDPEYAIIQCGLGNSYGHPHAQVLDRLSNYDSDMAIYRNDTNGRITLSISTTGLNFALENDDCSMNMTAGKDMPTSLNMSFEDYMYYKQMLVA